MTNGRCLSTRAGHCLLYLDRVLSATYLSSMRAVLVHIKVCAQLLPSLSGSAAHLGVNPHLQASVLCAPILVLDYIITVQNAARLCLAMLPTFRSGSSSILAAATLRTCTVGRRRLGRRGRMELADLGGRSAGHGVDGVERCGMGCAWFEMGEAKEWTEVRSF